MPTIEGRNLAPILVALAGSLAYLAFLSWPTPGGVSYFGNDIYDEYYHAILDGRLNLSARVLRFEGHYLADGTAFTYHGLAPLIPRFLLGWLLPTDGSVFPILTIFASSVGGTLLLQRIVRERAAAAQLSPGLQAVLLVACWTAAPGMMLVANSSVYHEPIAIAFLCTMLFFFALHRREAGHWSLRTVLLVGALAAAVAFHARPHVGAAICVGLAIIGLHGIATRERWLVGSVAGAALVAASLAGYFAVNHSKFGDVATGHAGFSDDAPVRYGFVFFGHEEPDSPRARGFEDHGRFNLARVPSHLYAHAILFGKTRLSQTAYEAVGATGRWHGYSRFETPLLGFFFLFTPWIAIAIFGAHRGRPRIESWAMLGSGAVMTLAILAYPTIGYRYRAEIFPLVLGLALMALPGLRNALAGKEGRIRRYALLLSIVAATITTISASAQAHKELLAHRTMLPWTEDRCLFMLEERAGVTPLEARRSCNP